jgi:hypothetical protein
MTNEQKRKAWIAYNFARYSQFTEEHTRRHIQDITGLTEDEVVTFLFEINKKMEELPF